MSLNGFAERKYSTAVSFSTRSASTTTPNRSMFDDDQTAKIVKLLAPGVYPIQDFEVLNSEYIPLYSTLDIQLFSNPIVVYRKPHIPSRPNLTPATYKCVKC